MRHYLSIDRRRYPHHTRAITTIKLVTALFICNLPASCSSGFGRCPRHEFMKNFNLVEFLGQWYEVERSFYLMELTASCTTINLTENAKGQVDVYIKTIGRWSGSVQEVQGIATKSKRDSTIFLYKVQTKLPNVIAKLLPGGGYYQILKTDYSNYAILWTCSTSMGLLHTDYVWILGRRRELDVSERSDIYDFLASRHIDSERLIISKNDNCSETIKNSDSGGELYSGEIPF